VSERVICSGCHQPAMLVDDSVRAFELEGLEDVCNVCKRPGTVRSVPSQGGYVWRFIAARAKTISRGAP
jgi:hypothetical protein